MSIAGPSPQGDLLLFRRKAGGWECRNLSAMLGRKVLAGQPASWVSAAGSIEVEHIATVGMDGEVLVFWRFGGGNWEVVDVSQISGQKVRGYGANRKPSGLEYWDV